MHLLFSPNFIHHRPQSDRTKKERKNAGVGVGGDAGGGGGGGGEVEESSLFWYDTAVIIS